VSFTTASPLNIPSIVGGNTAYAGFTAGPGATQTILNWTYVGSPTGLTATPTFMPVAGTYTGTQSVTISDATNGAVIYYTTNGTQPTTSSPVYSSPISVAANETLNAIALASGDTTSAVGSAVYKIRAATPSFAPAPGTYAVAQSVTITDGTSGAVIYYTTDGTIPTTSSTVYSGPISVTADETLKAIAVASGYTTSSDMTAAYKIETATPTFTPVAGTYPGTQSVTISDAFSGAVIYYTTNGTMPTTSSAVYSGPITVTADETIRAIAVANGYVASAVGTDVYNIRTPTPSFAPAPGTYSGTQSVTITDSMSGAVIYYTTNGTVPTTSSTLYSGPISVGANVTLKAIAVASGYANSTDVTGAYKILTATPTFTPVAGTYSGTQSVAITDGTSGAVIYYTTDGSTPTTSSSVYSSAITVSADETVKALALASGYATSSVGSAVYKIRTASPSFSPVAGSYSSAQSVTIGDATSGAVIYYTTDGSTPTTSSLVYSGPISVSANETLKAIAVASGYVTSSAVTAVYNILAATPVFSPGTDHYTTPQTPTIADTTSGAVIYFTTDGSTPTPSSQSCSSVCTLSSESGPGAVTLKAIAVAPGYATSAVGRAVYTFPPG
jgi:stage V sporulation protein SpoVS